MKAGNQTDRTPPTIRRLPEGWRSERCKIDEMTASDIPVAQQLYLASRYIEKWDGLETDPLFAERHYNGEDLPPGGVKERLQNQIVRTLEDDTPIGMLSVYHGYPDDSVMYIGFFCIDPSAQSKGFGREVISVANVLAERLGYGETRVAVALKNWPALRFWSGCGFNRVVRIVGDALHAEDAFSTIVFSNCLQRNS
ncbi:GNAT family N-acetyltransferase [Paenibacillus thermotolerans]|uniref:GNAT family N-acetyltransferase n=1 Tax=Paenibacillus thermotolerans TaxID=3027807 RepID=UPI0023687982|nr:MULTISPECIES: GNAT family N-acetyltransferase [unclassified Paenibacillus]